jgi:hypothetical protein
MFWAKLIAASVAIMVLAGAAQGRGLYRSGAGGWICADWAVAKPNSRIDREALQWVLGFLSAKIERDVVQAKFLGPDEIWREARNFCRGAPHALLEEVAGEIYKGALARAAAGLTAPAP